MYENSYAFIIIKRIALTFFFYTILMLEIHAPELTQSTKHTAKHIRSFRFKLDFKPNGISLPPQKGKKIWRTTENYSVVSFFNCPSSFGWLLSSLSLSLPLSLPSVRRPFIFFWLQEKSCHIQLFLFKFLLAFIHKMIYLFPFAEWLSWIFVVHSKFV